MKLVRWSCVALVAGLVACDSSDNSRGSGSPSSQDGDPASGDGADGADGASDGETGDGAETGDGSGGGDNDPGDVCERATIRAQPTIPDMLIVLDRSGSMREECSPLDIFCDPSTLVNRWDPSVNALKSVTSQLESKVRFGLMLFPSNDQCGEGTLEVPVDLNTAGPIASALDGTEPGGGTPTGSTLEQALTVIDQPAPPDTVKPPRFVLLVTDGQPTCDVGEGSMATPQDKARTVEAIDSLLGIGTKTFVIGYDAQLDPQFQAALTEFAQHGGTDDYRKVENEQQLVTELEAIAGDIVSCSFVLDEQPTDPTYVKVTLDGDQKDLNDPNGWTIVDKTVTLVGDACATLQDGAEHALQVEVLCEQVVPQ